MSHRHALVITLTLLASFAAGVRAQDPSPSAAPAAARQAYGRMAMQFEPAPDPADGFLARGAGYAVRLHDQGAELLIAEGGQLAASVGLTLQGAAPSRPMPSGRSGRMHYYLGADASQWRTDVPTFERVSYPAAYPGIDLVFYGNQRRLEYDFVVAPGADWRRIRLSFRGVDRLAVDDRTGELLLHVGDRVVRQPQPFTYQGHRDAPETVTSRYVIHSDGTAGFDIGAFDSARTLVIDPVIVYSTFLGGTGDDTAQDVAVDATGAAYVVGETYHH